ncbi:MAG: 3-oxoadipyl-CoA thiolase [Saprospiraceae bacterium]
MQSSYIIDGVRTPIGRLRGALSSVRADDLAAIPLKALLEKYPSLDPALIDDVILGCANQAGEDNRNVARMALLLAGFPHSVPGETVNRLCASGMSSVVQAHRAITCGDAQIVIAGGVEHMTRAPLVMSKSAIPYGGHQELFDSSFGWRFVNPNMQALYGTDAMGVTAENLAAKYHIDRNDQDAFALWSQQKASKALASGIFADEIIPVNIKEGKQVRIFKDDEFIKPETTLEALSALRPAFVKEGSVTAGNASGINDGAAALLLASEGILTHCNLKPIARIVSTSVVGVEPSYMGIGPVGASKKALEKAGLTLNQMDIIEINEAFAVQVLACLRALQIADDDPRVNPNGGAIALGHPLGMTGARIILTAALQLHRKNLRYALVTMCVGVGQGYAVILEKV